MNISRLSAFCEHAYERFHRPSYIAPDPLEVVREYDHPSDREVVGLIASSLALGRVNGIVTAVRGVVGRIEQRGTSPAAVVREASVRELGGLCAGFRYRFFDSEQLHGLLCGIRSVLRVHGSIESCFAAGIDDTTHETRLFGGIASLVRWLVDGAGGRLDESILLSRPERGSACKRLLLYTRWMVRSDGVDPGGWNAIGPESLYYPVDAHVLRVARTLGISKRAQATRAVSRETTDWMRAISPEDPVRYDFCLTRPGIHPLLDEAAWLEGNRCTVGRKLNTLERSLA